MTKLAKRKDYTKVVKGFYFLLPSKIEYVNCNYKGALFNKTKQFCASLRIIL